jgi:hypothetical protein
MSTDNTTNTNSIVTPSEETNTVKHNRSFKVKREANGQLTGRYNGESPYQAANKALSEIIRQETKNGNAIEGEIKFFLVESTKGSSKKVHEYSGRRIKLDVPVEYSVSNGATIKKEYKNVLRKVKKTVASQVGGAETTTVQPTILSAENTTNGSTIVVSTV